MAKASLLSEIMLSCKLVYNSVFAFRSFLCLCYVGALISLTKRLLRFDRTTISDNRRCNGQKKNTNTDLQKTNDRATWTPLKTGGELTVKRHEQTHYYNRYNNLVHFYDVRLIWMHVDIKIFLPLFGQFSEIIVSLFICLCSLIPTRIWGTHTDCFKDNTILWQNVCPDFYIQHEQIISPFQRRNTYCLSGISSSYTKTTLSTIETRWHNLQLVEGGPGPSLVEDV